MMKVAIYGKGIIGGSTPGLGCTGRGIIATFNLLEELKFFETYKPDVVLYYVLGNEKRPILYYSRKFSRSR